MAEQTENAAHVKSQLGLWDTISIIVGIVVGVSIFKAPPLIFANVATPWHAFAAWTIGGLLALVGALCYAELATTYPRSGGDYVYLSRAFGGCTGFLFGWAHLAVVSTGSIGIMAYVFGDYAIELFGTKRSATVGFAMMAVIALTIVNCGGLVIGKTTQNILTLTKILGIAAILVSGIWFGSAPTPMAEERPLQGPGFGLAMVMVLYSYGGWNDAAFVTAEIRDRRRNIARALLLGIAMIVVVYLLINLAYLRALGFDGIRQSTIPAADVLRLSFGDWASRALSLTVMISALGAINGMILTGSRLFAEVGREHAVLSRLGKWHPRLNVPVWSLLAQAGVSISLILVVGTDAGRAFVDACFRIVQIAPADWQRFGGGFETLIAGTSPVFWFFFLMTGVALFVLRRKDGEIRRPFSVPWFPITPLVFCGMCGYMLYSSVAYAGSISLMGIGPLLLGVPIFLMNRLFEADDQPHC
jgi:amino acid transporter